jgi:hypothetical protein
MKPTLSFRRLLTSLLCASAFVACSGGEENAAGMDPIVPGPPTSATAPAVSPSAAVAPVGAGCFTDTATVDEDGNWLLMANPANNYSFTSDITVSVTSVAPNTELTFDWSTLTKDFIGHSMDAAASVDMAVVILWQLTHEQMQEKLNNDDLAAADAAAAIALYTEKMRTNGSIFEFVVAGGGELPREELMTRLDPTQFDPAQYTYTVMPSEGTFLGRGVKAVQAFRLDPASANTRVDITEQSTALTYAVDLQSLTPIKFPAGTNAVTVDWSDMETNALGRPFVERSIYEVMVAHYAMTPAELEAQFLDLELIADQMWRGDVPAGDDLSLTELVDANGQPFTGIDGTGTWVLALICGTCGNPAPWYLTRLETCQ